MSKNKKDFERYQNLTSTLYSLGTSKNETSRQEEIRETIERIESMEGIITRHAKTTEEMLLQIFSRYRTIMEERYVVEANREQIGECLRTAAERYSTVNSDFASVMDMIIEKVPEESFGIYVTLLERAFSDNSITGYNAEKIYHKVVSLIGEHLARAKFLKSVLRVVDREVCSSIEDALPHDHPYLREGE